MITSRFEKSLIFKIGEVGGDFGISISEVVLKGPWILRYIMWCILFCEEMGRLGGYKEMTEM